MKLYKKAILPRQFKANAIASGIKKSGKLDLALLYSDIPFKAACQFTTNKIQAAPVRVSKEYLRNNREYKAVIINSGNANCVTGNQGIEDARGITKIVADNFGIGSKSVLVASTGIIGKRLPVVKITKAIPQLVRGLCREGIDKTKLAIMTTDTFSKEFTAKFNIKGQTVTICGIAKGAGMIAPNLATMLVFILTDANITRKALEMSLNDSVGNSFNCLTVDGCMSTNDSVMLLANGAAKNILIDTGSKRSPSQAKNKAGKNYNLFFESLNTVCVELAKSIAKDAEGATKFITIRVDKAANIGEAKKIALAVANSNLFKCAIYGENPNFGRIAAAAGACGVDIKEENLKIKVSSLKRKTVNVCISVKRGGSSATVYTSDLTPAYVKINAEYN